MPTSFEVLPVGHIQKKVRSHLKRGRRLSVPQLFSANNRVLLIESHDSKEIILPETGWANGNNPALAKRFTPYQPAMKLAEYIFRSSYGHIRGDICHYTGLWGVADPNPDEVTAPIVVNLTNTDHIHDGLSENPALNPGFVGTFLWHDATNIDAILRARTMTTETHQILEHYSQTRALASV